MKQQAGLQLCELETSVAELILLVPPAGGNVGFLLKQLLQQRQWDGFCFPHVSLRVGPWALGEVVVQGHAEPSAGFWHTWSRAQSR